MFKKILFLASLVMIGGCQTTSVSNLEPAEPQNPALASYPSVGDTYLLFSAFSGYEVRYYETSGRYWSWLPAVEDTVHARWHLKSNKQGKATALCWEYGPPSWNPIWKKANPIVNCPHMVGALAKVVAVKNGDIFNLTGDKPVPFIRFACDIPPAFKDPDIRVTPERNCDQAKFDKLAKNRGAASLGWGDLVSKDKRKEKTDPRRTFKVPEALKAKREYRNR